MYLKTGYMKPIKLGIAEDHSFVRKGIINSCREALHCEFVAEGANGKELINALEKTASLPDIVLLDYYMPVLNGLDTVKIIKAEYPSIKILVISALEDRNAITNLFNHGINGYISKCDPKISFSKALLDIYHSGYFINRHFVAREIKNIDWDKVAFAGNCILKHKEFEFMSLCTLGLPYKAIADKMNVSVKTVENYRDSIYEKLEISSREELLKFAMKCGLAVF